MALDDTHLRDRVVRHIWTEADIGSNVLGSLRDPSTRLARHYASEVHPHVEIRLDVGLPGRRVQEHCQLPIDHLPVSLLPRVGTIGGDGGEDLELEVHLVVRHADRIGQQNIVGRQWIHRKADVLARDDFGIHDALLGLVRLQRPKHRHLAANACAGRVEQLCGAELTDCRQGVHESLSFQLNFQVCRGRLCVISMSNLGSPCHSSMQQKGQELHSCGSPPHLLEIGRAHV